ncbi:MAG: hypothetical protein P1V51_22235 [Deltaproteobacteria bacterium]|nr:hypothetical protein [Deltaproteobacteria bacterium]
MRIEGWRGAALLLAAHGLIAGCGRDFLLPPPDETVVLEGFSPTTGFAGTRVRIRGAGFAAENEVVFASGQRVPAHLSPEGGALEVVVPDDAGRGPLVIHAGPRSAATAEPFEYLGRGRPASGTRVATVRILHRPRALALAGGRLIYPSTLFRQGFVDGSDLRFFLESKPIDFAASSDGARVYAAYSDDGVQGFDTTDGALVSSLDPADLQGAMPTRIVPVDAGGQRYVYVTGIDPAGRAHALAFDPGLAPAGPPRRLAMSSIHGAAATTRSGRLVVVGDSLLATGSEHGLSVIDPRGNDLATWVPVEQDVELPGPVTTYQQGTDEFAAIARTDGRLALLGLTGGIALTGALIDTGSTSLIGDLAATSEDPTLGVRIAVTHPLDGSVSLYDTAGQRLWATGLASQPERLVIDEAAGLVYASDTDSNYVDVLALATGRWQRRISFDVGLGSTRDAACGAALVPDEEEVFLIARRAHALVRVGVGTLQPAKPRPMAPGTSPLLCVGTAPDGTLWVVHERELGYLDLESDEEVIRLPNLPHRPLGIEFGDEDRIFLPHLTGVMALQGGARKAGLALGAEERFELLATLPDGDVMVLWSASGSGERHARGGLWTAQGLQEGEPPHTRLTEPEGFAEFFGAVMLEHGPVLHYRFWPGEGEDEAIVGLGHDLTPLYQTTSEVDQVGPIVVTPDRRHYLWNRRETPSDFLLRMVTVDPGTPEMIELSYMDVTGPIGGATFDPTGERLFVPIVGTEEILIFE